MKHKIFINLFGESIGMESQILFQKTRFRAEIISGFPVQNMESKLATNKSYKAIKARDLHILILAKSSQECENQKPVLEKNL